jgi:hypothetical protein
LTAYGRSNAALNERRRKGICVGARSGIDRHTGVTTHTDAAFLHAGFLERSVG